MTLQAQLENYDLRWISDFENAVARASYEFGLLQAARETNDIASLHKATKVDARVLNAVIPVLANTGLLSNDSIPPAPELGTRVPRLLELFKGGEAFLELKGKSFSAMWERGDIDLESAKEFSSGMYESSLLPAKIHCASKPFEKISSLVDLGGGGGAWASEALRTRPDLQYTIFDLEAVCAATKDILNQRAPEIRKPLYHPGSFFRDSLPTAEGYLLSNILHDWNPEACLKLMRRIHDEMPPKAFLFINECLLNAQKSGPRFTSLFNLLMLLNHGSQQFTELELSEILAEAGFTIPQVISSAAHYSLLVAQKQ